MRQKLKRRLVGKTSFWVAGLSGIDDSDARPPPPPPAAYADPTPEEEAEAMQADLDQREEENPWAEDHHAGRDRHTEAAPPSDAVDDVECQPCGATVLRPTFHHQCKPAVPEPASRLRAARNKLRALTALQKKRTATLHIGSRFSPAQRGQDLTSLRGRIATAQREADEIANEMPPPPAPGAECTDGNPDDPKRPRITAVQKSRASANKLEGLRKRRVALEQCKRQDADSDEEYVRQIRCGVMDKRIRAATVEHQQNVENSSVLITAQATQENTPEQTLPAGTLEAWLEELLDNDPLPEQPPTSPPQEPEVRVALPVARPNPWSQYPQSLIADLVDLADLGGQPTWPENLTYQSAVDELRARRSAGMCTTEPPPKRSAFGVASSKITGRMNQDSGQRCHELPLPIMVTAGSSAANGDSNLQDEDGAQPQPNSQDTDDSLRTAGLEQRDPARVTPPPRLEEETTCPSVPNDTLSPPLIVQRRPPGRPMGTSARAGEAKRQAERRALKLATEAKLDKPPDLQKTMRALDRLPVNRASSSALDTSPAAPQPSSTPAAMELAVRPTAGDRTQPASSQSQTTLTPSADNWRKRKAASQAQLKPREIAEDENDASLTPAQRTLARLRRRVQERELQQQDCTL